jgi:DNA-binding SARP family transcriptional activator
VSVIECQVALGNRAAAIAEYQRLRSDLKRSLDVEPLPETDQAVQKALGSAVAGAARTSQPQPVQ